jgi:hypothetical protein
MAERERIENLIEYYRSLIAGTEKRLADPEFAGIMDAIYATEARAGALPGGEITFREAYERQLANARDRLAYYQSLLTEG